MIFITVGTHEQPFDRLLKGVDKMIDDGIIKEEVICQKGYSTYEPKNYIAEKLIPYEQMQENIRKARIVKRKDIEMKPMDEEEAILEMELLGHSFFVYKDVNTKKVCVLYKRKNGNYGIIETE